MAEYDSRATPDREGGFDTKARVLDAPAVERAIRRIAHEILERNEGAENLVLVALQTGGVPVCLALQSAIADIENVKVPTGTLDVVFYRDDIGSNPVMSPSATAIPVDVTQQIVVLVDDVLFTGRTIRSALDAIHDFGRPAAIQLAVLVDRGHRELPIRPDYVGKNVPTSISEVIDVRDDGVYLLETKS